MKGNKHTLGLLLICSVFMMLTSCISHEVKEAAAFAAQLVESSHYEVDVREESTAPVYDVRIQHAKFASAFSGADIVSTCALAFYNKLPNHDESFYVRMNIANDSNSFQQTYSSAELRCVDRCIENVSTFFRWHPNLGVDNIRPILDSTFFPASVIDFFAADRMRKDSLDNAFLRCEFHGFELDTIGNRSAITLKVDAINKQSKESHKAVLSQESQQLLFLVQDLNQTKR